MKHHKKKRPVVLFGIFTDPCDLYSKLCSPETENGTGLEYKTLHWYEHSIALVAERARGRGKEEWLQQRDRVELWHCQASLQKLTGYRQAINSLPSSGSITWISFALIRHLNERVLLSK